jgi:hypothetical protein
VNPVNAKRRILTALSILLALTAAILFVSASLSMLLDKFREGLDAGPRILLYHTNHAAVLQACQSVLADPQAAGFPMPTNGVTTLDGLQSGGNPPVAFPATLRNLNFEFMTVQGNQATIYFGGGFGHWGFSTASMPGGPRVQVIPGLWFWSEYGLPRDPSKSPYYRIGECLLLGSAVSTAAAILLRAYRRRTRSLGRQ